VDDENDTTRLSLEAAERSGSRVATLIVMSGGAIGRMFAVSGAQMVIGRSAEADIRIDDEGISRKHAEIVRGDDGTIEIVDLDSRNGTFVNMKRIERQVLGDGDKIQLGAVTILKFGLQSKLEERFAQRLYDSATRDTLTNAYNRRFFDDQMAKDYSHARRHKTSLSLLMLDVDHFKRVNDTHGHLAGDDVLKQLGALVVSSIRLEDVFCRLGGEEFGIIMRDAGTEHAVAFGERLRGLVESTTMTSGEIEVSVTISVGAATFDLDRDLDAAGFIERADRALYEAKNGGRNRVCGAD
jgi:diguanylate cyclase (GGDEF)-like protein